jgi:hypothetical protein
MAETLEVFRRKVNTEHREATTRSRSLQNRYIRDTSSRILTELIYATSTVARALPFLLVPQNLEILLNPESQR